MVVAAGNDPTVAVPDFFDGPPWVISVGGAQASTGGETVIASRGVDVSANFSAQVATRDSIHGVEESAGTSLSAPVVAGTLAEALRLADLPPGIERRDAMRRALNATAEPFAATDWSPRDVEPSLYGVLSVTAPVLAPGPQGGWGFVHGGLAPTLAEAAEGDGSTPASARAAWQERWQAARVAYWSSVRTG